MIYLVISHGYWQMDELSFEEPFFKLLERANFPTSGTIRFMQIDCERDNESFEIYNDGTIMTPKDKKVKDFEIDLTKHKKRIQELDKLHEAIYTNKELLYWNDMQMEE